MKEILKNKVQVIITSVLAVIILTLSIVGGITISNLNNQINDLNNQLENMNKVDEDLDSYIKTIETELNTIKTNLNSTNTKISELEVAFGTDLEEAEENILNELNNVKTSLETEVEEISTLIEELTNKDSALESRISSLENSVNNLNATLEALIIQVNKNAEDIKALEDIIAGLEIRVNCLEGKHIASESTIYTWSEDYNEVTADGNCARCEEPFHYTVPTTYLDGIVSAEFEFDGFEKQTKEIILATRLTNEELTSDLENQIQKGTTDISIHTPKEASIELFQAIQEGLVNASDGTINLTLSGVETILDLALKDCESLKTLSLLAVTTLEKRAIHSCGKLESIVAPKVVYVGEEAFASCGNLQSIELPLVETIGYQAFYNCGLIDINFPRVIFVGEQAFYLCRNLQSIDLPLTETIGNAAFRGCTNLKNVNLPFVKEIGEEAFRDCKNLEKIDLPSLKTIGDGAFDNCEKLTSINIPEVTTIGSEAFAYCAFSEIILPKVTSVGEDAFTNCEKLTKVTFGTFVTYFGAFVFDNTKQIELVFAKGQKNFEDDGNSGWTITEEDVPIGSNVNFLDETFKSITVVENIDATNLAAEELKEELLHASSIDINIKLPANPSNEMLDAIREGLANASDGIINLTLSGVETISDNAFLNLSNYEDNFRSLKSIYLPDVTSIGMDAFTGCYKLEAVNAPKVITIGEQAFRFLSNLKSVNLPLAKTIGSNAFENCYNLENIDLPSAKLLGDNAFTNCSKLTSINIPNVTTIEKLTFAYCAFNEINLPSVISIGDKAFWGVTGLRKVTFGAPLTEIGKDIFYSPNDYYKVDTTQIDLVFTSGQKNFSGDNTNGWTITEDDVPTGSNVKFLGYTFKSITIDE